MINRAITDKVLEASKKMPVITVTGPRQSGKSTLVKKIFPEYNYVNLEDIEKRNFAKEDPKGFLKNVGRKVVIDEVQHVPDLLSYIQVDVDAHQAARNYVLTGSQNLLLMEQVSQSLAGRTSIFNLLPFSLGELESTKYAFEDYEDYIIKGFYPRIYNENLDANSWLLDYIRTYVERDVRQLINLADEDTFQQFLQICAGRTGQIVNLSDIGNLVGASYQTIKRWISILKTSFIIYTLRPYHKNYNKRVIKSPKLYFYDTGLACALMNIRSKEELNIHFAKGALFENFVITEMMKKDFNQAKRGNFYYWRNSSGNEIDLLIDRGMKIYPFEMKASRTVQPKFFKGLNYFNEISENPASQSFLVYGGDEKQERSYGNVIGWKHLVGLDI